MTLAQATDLPADSYESLSRDQSDARRELVTAFVQQYAHETNEAVLKRVQGEIAAGNLPGPVPHLGTVWRWLKPFRQQKRQQEHALLADLQANSNGRPTRLAHVRALGIDPTHAELLDQVAALEALAEDHKGRLGAAGAFTQDLVCRHKQESKWAGKAIKAERSRRGPWRDKGLLTRIAALRALISDYEAALGQALGHRPRNSTEEITVVAQMPNATPERASTGSLASTGQSAAKSVATSHSDSETLPLYRTDGDQDRELWGAEFDQIPHGTLGAIIGYAVPQKTRDDATARLTLVAPVLNGIMSCEACAAAWRDVFAGKPTSDSSVWLSPPHNDYQIIYRHLSGNTMRQWYKKILDGRFVTRERGVVASDLDSLLHHQPDTVRRVRAGTIEQRDEIIREFKNNPNFSAVLVCEELNRKYGIQISERTIQRVIANKLIDADRVSSRAGPAGHDQLIRFRLIREAPYANRAWIMDHTFFSVEEHDPSHPEWIDGVRNGRRDLDLEFECVREIESVGSIKKRKRVKKVTMTVIIDACTRRILAVRLWDGAPCARDTLLALRDAMERFGTPEILYTDNGSDLKAKIVNDALCLAGITHVLSMPYCPEGRGKIEVVNRIIKGKILASLPGYCGNHTNPPDDELLVLEDVERRIMARIDESMNGKCHGETGRIPTVHYNESIGARGLLGRPALADALLALLVVREDVRVSTDGAHGNGKRYVGPGLMGVPIGSTVAIFSDPYRPRLAYAGVRDHNGVLRNNGPLKVYGASDPAPDFVEWNHLTHKWTTERNAEVADLRAKQRIAAAAGERRARGEQRGAELASQTSAEIAALTNPSPARMLATGDPVAPHTEGAPNESSHGDAVVDSAAVGDTAVADPSMEHRYTSVADEASTGQAAAPSNGGGERTGFSDSVERHTAPESTPADVAVPRQREQAKGHNHGTEPRSFILPY